MVELISLRLLIMLFLSPLSKIGEWFVACDVVQICSALVLLGLIKLDVTRYSNIIDGDLLIISGDSIYLSGLLTAEDFADVSYASCTIVFG